MAKKRILISTAASKSWKKERLEWPILQLISCLPDKEPPTLDGEPQESQCQNWLA